MPLVNVRTLKSTPFRCSGWCCLIQLPEYHNPLELWTFRNRGTPLAHIRKHLILNRTDSHVLIGRIEELGRNENGNVRPAEQVCRDESQRTPEDTALPSHDAR